jgi:hypothetical protein
MTRTVFNTFSLATVAIFLSIIGPAFAQTCGPGNPLDNICTEQAEISASLAQLQDDVDDLDAGVSGTVTDLSVLDTKITDMQSDIDALGAAASRLESSLSELGVVFDRIDSNLEAHRAAAHKFWTSPLWEVLEGASTTEVTVLNLGMEEVEVVFTFFNRDGVINRRFSTNRLLPGGASITLDLDDRGVSHAEFGWFAVTASGPVQVDGFINLSRGELALSRQYSERTLRFYPIDCKRDPATWPSTNAPYLCDFIDRELRRLW